MRGRPNNAHSSRCVIGGHYIVVIRGAHQIAAKTLKRAVDKTVGLALNHFAGDWRGEFSVCCDAPVTNRLDVIDQVVAAGLIKNAHIPFSTHAGQA
ncbi:hypothetical protein D3C77_288460 [compost metagenome]